MADYLLRYEGKEQFSPSAPTISNGKTIMLLKPADDRSINDGFRVNPCDYVEWKVIKLESAIREMPTGGLAEITILHLERVPVEPENVVTHGG